MATERRDGTTRRRAFIFPGVGVRLCGKEPEFFAAHREVMAPLLDEASRFAGADLLPLLEAPAERERDGQLFTYAFDVAAARVFLSRGIEPVLCAGHSLGIYAALAVAGALHFDAGLRVVAEAHRLVSDAAGGLDASMAVVVGLERREVEELIASRPTEERLALVNANNDTTFVVAGLRSGLEGFLEAARARDALKAKLLPVGAPYHHPSLLRDVNAPFRAFLERFEWRPARWPIVSSLDRRLLSEPAELLDFTARNLTTPIDWSAVVRRLSEARIDQLVECGPGITLAQNGRLIDGCPPVVTVKNASRRLLR